MLRLPGAGVLAWRLWTDPRAWGQGQAVTRCPRQVGPELTRSGARQKGPARPRGRPAAACISGATLGSPGRGRGATLNDERAGHSAAARSTARREARGARARARQRLAIRRGAGRTGRGLGAGSVFSGFHRSTWYSCGGRTSHAQWPPLPVAVTRQPQTPGDGTGEAPRAAGHRGPGRVEAAPTSHPPSGDDGSRGAGVPPARHISAPDSLTPASPAPASVRGPMSPEGLGERTPA